nr:hypothetical protein [Candidatus Neptunochlamydia vexilliferae]
MMAKAFGYALKDSHKEGTSGGPQETSLMLKSYKPFYGMGTLNQQISKKIGKK